MFETPQVILLNGASSSGKSTLARELLKELPHPYLHYSSDLLVAGGVLPNVNRDVDDTPWSWNVIRPKFFDGFHRSIAQFAEAGNLLLVEHVVEYESWLRDLVKYLAPYKVLYVGVTCPVHEIERREKLR
jgi:chloramphenicol 3-O phosphotransferase